MRGLERARGLVRRLAPRRRRSGRLGAGVVVALVAFVATSANAWGDASVVIGPPNLSGFSSNGVGCFLINTGGCTEWLANLTPPAGVTVIVPDDGTVTAWTANGSVSSGQMKLIVLRPVGGGSYNLIPPESSAGAVDGTTSNSTSLPVDAGDALAAEVSCMVSAGSCYSQLYSQQPTGATYGTWSSGSFPSAPATSSGELALNADVTLDAPIVTSVSPASGSTGGGASVTVTGQHLANATGVSFGGSPATVVSNSNTQLTVTAPAHVAGAVDVRVTTAGGPSATSSADHYSYVAPSGITPGITPGIPPAIQELKARIKSATHTAKFTFESTGATGFQCALVKRKKHRKKPTLSFSSCRSPKTYKHLKAGKYTFAVRALSPAGHGAITTRNFKIA